MKGGGQHRRIYIYARCKDDEKSDNAAEDKSRESKGKPKDKRKEIEQKKKGTEEGVRVEAKRRLLFLWCFFARSLFFVLFL